MNRIFIIIIAILGYVNMNFAQTYHMEYMFPDQGFAECNDQFMLGERYLVAPMVTPDDRRTVTLPKGNWRDEKGVKYQGGKTISIQADIDRLPYFEKVK